MAAAIGRAFGRNRPQGVQSVSYSLIEKRDTCAISTVSRSGTLALTGAADTMAMVGKNIVVGRLQLVDGDTAALAGTAQDTSPPTFSDFVARRTSAGVLNWHKYDYVDPASFNDPVAMASISPSPILGVDARGNQYGNFATRYGWAVGEIAAADPVIDQTVTVSGTGSLKLTFQQWPGSTTRNTIAAGGDPGNPGGYASVNFSNTLDTFIGAGQKVYYQWRWRCDQPYLDFIGVNGSGTRIGPKMMIGTVGDNYLGVPFGQNHVNNQMHFSDYQSYKLPVMSQGSVPDGLFEGSLTINGQTEFLLENACNPLCTWHATSFPNCFQYRANEWATFQVCIDLTNSTFDSVTKTWPNSVVKVWAAHENEPSRLIIWWRPGVTGYRALEAAGSMGAYPTTAEQKFGKVNLMNFLTGNPSTATFTTWHQWYDEVIISTQQIPDPSTGNAALAVMPTNSIKYLTQFNPQKAVGETISQFHVTDQAGMYYDAGRKQFVQWGGGHSGTSNDAVHSFSLGTNGTLLWTTDYQPTPWADRLMTNFDAINGAWKNPKLTNPSSSASGPYPRPATRHTGQGACVVGNELIVYKYIEGCGQPGDLSSAGSWWHFDSTTNTFTLKSGGDEYSTRDTGDKLGPSRGKIARYNLDTKTWSFSAKDCIPATYLNPNTTGEINMSGWAAACYDPQSRLSWIISRDAAWTYDRITDTRVRVGFVGLGNLGTNQAMVYCPLTDKYYYFRHVGPAAPAQTGGTINVTAVTINRSTNALSFAALTPTGSYVTQPQTDPQGRDQNNSEKSWDYDPFTKKIWMGPVVPADGSVSFVGYDPVANTWTTTVAGNSTDAGFTVACQLFHHGRIDPETGAWVWIDINGRTWAWKPS